MSETRNDGLDDRIRTLVARAVADAPPAPVIDERTIADGPIVRSIGSAPSQRNRWIVGGLAIATTAAAVVAIALVARPDSAEAPAPATLPPATTLATLISDPTQQGTTVAPTTSAAPTSTAPPLPTAPPTIAPPEPAPGLPEVIVVAGDDGIQIDTGDALSDALLGESVRTAVRVPDGRIFAQRRDDPLMLQVLDGAFTPIAMPADFPGAPLLHDAAEVNGEVVLLVESTPAEPCAGGDGCIGSVWAVWPDRGEGVMLDEQNVWEAAWSRLSLASTGVAVGMFSAEVSNSPWSMVIPGSAATPLDPTTVGLDEVYTDCSTCPIALTIDATGRYVGWVVRPAEGAKSIVVVHLADGAAVEHEIADAADLPSFVSLDIGALDVSNSLWSSARAILNDVDPTSASPAVVYDLLQPGGEPIVIGKPASRMAFGY